MTDDVSLTEQQASLFPEWERDLLTIDQPETRKRYTAASLERNVAKRDLIVRAVAEGHGLLRIAKAFGVSHHLVSALRDTHPELVAIEKQSVGRQLGRLIKLTADSLEERLVSGKLKPGSVDLAILIDKKAAIDGDPALIVEHRHTVSASAEGFRARLRAAVDSPSLGSASKPQQTGGIVDVDATLVPSAVVQSGPEPVLGPHGGPRATTGGGDALATVAPHDPMHPSLTAKEQKPS